jgi:hypothetical protein
MTNINDMILSKTPIADLLGFEPPKYQSHIAFRSRKSGKIVAAIVYVPRSEAGQTYEGAYKLCAGFGESNPCFTPLRGDARAVQTAFERRFRVTLADVTVDVHDAPPRQASAVERELRA